MNGYLKGESWRLTMDLIRILVLSQQWESSRVITRNHSHCTNIGYISPVNSETEYCKPTVFLAVWYSCTCILQLEFSCGVLAVPSNECRSCNSSLFGVGFCFTEVQFLSRLEASQDSPANL